MRFQFSLAAVLRLREIEQAREERRLTQVLAQLAEVEEALRMLHAQIVAARRSCDRALEMAISAVELVAFHSQLKALTERRGLAEQGVAEWQQLRDKQLALYRGAHQRCELLTTMRAEQHAAFLVREARQEQKSLDDLFLARRRPSRR